MIPARASHDPQQSVVHFKKRWLSHERALTSADQASSMIRPFAPPAKEEASPATPALFPFACPASPSTATTDPSSFHSGIDRSMAACLRRHPSAADGVPPISLSIPRFAKYGAHAPLLAQCSTASSTLCSADSPSAPPLPSPAADLPQSWLLRAASSDAETCKLQLGTSKMLACQPSISTERLMIDINKPPPSPEGHSMDSEMTPSTPHSAPSAGLPGLPRAYGMAVMDYSFSDLDAAAPSWLASASAGGDSLRAAGPSSRKGPSSQSALLHLPTLRGGLPAGAGTSRRMAEPAKRQSGLSLSFPEQEASPPPPLASSSQPQQQKQKDSQPARRLARSGSNGAAAVHQGPTSTGRRPSPAAPSETPSPQPQPLRKPRSQWAAATGALLAHGRHAKAGSEEPAEQGEEEDEEHEEEEGEEEEEEEEEGEIVARRSGSEEDEGMGRGGSPKACLHCNTTKTPLWRNGPPGPKSLCNACGIRFNKIRSGKRKPTPKEAAMLLKYERSASTVTGTGASDVSAASSPERSSSKAAGLRADKRQGQGHGKGAEAEAERRLLQSLPVAGAHKSRSKMQRQNSTGARAGGPAVKVALFGGRKRSPESGEGYTEGAQGVEDDEEGRPLRLAFQHRSKRACLAGYGYAAGGLKGGPLFPREMSVSEEEVAAGRDGDSSSSDHESCLSEPGQSPPESPRGWKVQRGHVLSKAAVYEPGVPPALTAAASTDEADAEDDAFHTKGLGAKGGLGGGSDVEIGARLLMEIFHSSPLVMC